MAEHVAKGSEMMNRRARPLVIAHRGGAALWPENTMGAFRRALDMGCDGLEIDVRLSAEGVGVIHHDARLNPDFTRTEQGGRPTAPGPRLSKLTLEQIRKYRIGAPRPGSPYARDHPLLEPCDAPIPILAEALDLFTAHPSAPALCMVELKWPTRGRRAMRNPARLVDVTAAQIDRAGLESRAVIVGFNWNVLLAYRARRPEARLWFTTYPASWFRPGETPHLPPSPRRLAEMRALHAAGAPWMAGFHPGRFGSTPKALAAAGAQGWLVYGPDADDAEIREGRALGLQVGVWGVDDAEGMRRFMALDVQAICTDRPDILLAMT